LTSGSVMMHQPSGRYVGQATNIAQTQEILKVLRRHWIWELYMSLDGVKSTT
jgi:ATP-dependent protease ClpP protease subunit